MILLVLLSGTAGAKDLGFVGKVYPIGEPDALEEIEARAGKIRWEEVLSQEDRERLVRDYRPSDLEPLPRATEDRTRLVDLTYTLDVDLPDRKGGILYPKGHTFNPLEYVTYPNILVFLDGEDPAQVAWFQDSVLAEDPRVRLILSDGRYFEVIERVERPVFYLSAPIRERLQLEAVPAVAWQEGSAMLVREVLMPGNQAQNAEVGNSR